MNGYFGVAWDAPAFQEAPQLPTPVGESCSMCPDLILDGESGVIIAHLGEDGPSMRPQHIECFLRGILGSVAHLEGRCSCFGGDDADEVARRNYRASARETMEWLVRHGR